MIINDFIIKAYASTIKDIMNQEAISESDKRNVFETIFELRKAADRMDSRYADTLADAEERSMHLLYVSNSKKDELYDRVFLVQMMNEIIDN